MKKSCLSVGLSALLVTLMSTGCSEDAPATKGYNGIFIDSAVSGVSWSCGVKSGTTDSAGAFGVCPDGSTVTLKLGNITLGSLTAAQVKTSKGILTPRVMVQSASDVNGTTARMASLLQSLDSDGNASNGITITAGTVSALNQTQTTALDITTMTSGSVTSLITTTQATASANDTSLALVVVPEANATAHLLTTESNVTSGDIAPPTQTNPVDSTVTAL